MSFARIIHINHNPSKFYIHLSIVCCQLTLTKTRNFNFLSHGATKMTQNAIFGLFWECLLNQKKAQILKIMMFFAPFFLKFQNTLPDATCSNFCILVAWAFFVGCLGRLSSGDLPGIRGPARVPRWVPERGECAASALHPVEVWGQR